MDVKRPGPSGTGAWIAAAPAAAVVFWAIFSASILMIPIEPFRRAGWEAGELVWSLLLGLVAARFARGWAGVSGVVMGWGASNVVLMNVLVRQSAVNPAVVTAVIQARWLSGSLLALATSLGALLLGLAAGAAIRARTHRSGDDEPFRWRHPRAFGATCVVLGLTAGLVLVALMGAVGTSYVPGQGTTPGSGGEVPMALEIATYLAFLIAGWSTGGVVLATGRRSELSTLEKAISFVVVALLAIGLLAGWTMLAVEFAVHPM